MFSSSKTTTFYLIKTKLIIGLILISTSICMSFEYDSVSQKYLTIYIQPLGKVDSDYLNYIKKSVIDFYGYNCIIKTEIDLTNDILSGSKTRYDANKILEKYNSNSNLVLITEKDIAYKKSSQYPEWGVFGLGLRPGKVCVISTFRLRKNVSKEKMLVRLKKVALHEIGHNLGLSHCTNHRECMMNDADGTIKQVDKERIWFCEKCWGKLKK
jgi:archaemetzincin